MSDGTKRVDICGEAFRYEENGQLVEYDTSLVNLDKDEKENLKEIETDTNVKDYVAVNQQGDSKQYFPQKLDGEKAVIMNKDDYKFSFTPLTDGIVYSSSVSDENIVYKSDKSIAEYEYISLKNGVKENVILSSRPSSNKICFEVETENLDLELDESSKYINFLDSSTKKKVGYIMPPNVVDAEGEINYEDISYKIVEKNEKTILELIITNKYLNNASYPITVDPTAAWFNGKLPTAIVNSSQYTADMNLQSATLGVMNKCTTTSSEQRVYIDTSYIMSGNPFTGQQVDWTDKDIAKVTLSLTETDPRFTAGTVEIKKVNGIWAANTITWNTQPEIGDTIGSFACNGVEGTNHRIDLTDAVKSMISNGELSKGLVLTAKEEGTGESFLGPNPSSTGYMWISVIYDEEVISLTKYDYGTGKQVEYDYAYDGDLTNVVEQPYIPTNLATYNNLVEPFVMLPGDELQEENVNIYPYSAIVSLMIEKENGDGTISYTQGGTGFVVGPDTIVTAAHCVWKGENGYPGSIRMYYKYEGIMDSNYYTVETITVAGYAYSTTDKLYRLHKDSDIICSQNERTVFYYASTISGISGAPVFDSANIVWAVHSGGTSTYNIGARIDASIYSLLKQERQMGINRYDE